MERRQGQRQRWRDNTINQGPNQSDGALHGGVTLPKHVSLWFRCLCVCLSSPCRGTCGSHLVGMPPQQLVGGGRGFSLEASASCCGCATRLSPMFTGVCWFACLFTRVSHVVSTFNSTNPVFCGAGDSRSLPRTFRDVCVCAGYTEPTSWPCPASTHAAHL